MGEYKKRKKRFVRKLRKDITYAEKKLRKMLSVSGIKYVFQRPFTIGPPGQRGNADLQNLYIADFYLPDYAAIIEVDGDIHAETNQNIKDRSRSQALLSSKLVSTILRFHNNQVLQEPSSVLRTILFLKPVRMMAGIKSTKNENRKHNRKVQEANEVQSIIFTDPDLTWQQRRKLLNKTIDM